MAPQYPPLPEVPVEDAVGEALPADADALQDPVTAQLVQDQVVVHHAWGERSPGLGQGPPKGPSTRGATAQHSAWEEEEEDGAGQTVLGPQPPRAWQLCSAELQGSPGWHRLFQVLGI